MGKVGVHHSIILGILLWLSAGTVAQTETQAPPTITFSLDGNRVIVPTSVNGSPPLRLILDTGMTFDGVYLFHTDALKLIDTTGAIEVRVPGAGAGEASRATMIETGTLTFGTTSVSGQRVIVSHSAHTQGFPTDGIIGGSLFGHYNLEIDFDRGLIVLHDSTYVPSDTDWAEIPIKLKKGIPFLDATVEVVKGEAVPMRVYIDLASGDALELLVGPEQKFTMPDSLVQSSLGTGLSGDINGQCGMSQRVRIGGYDLVDVPTAFAPAKVRSKQEGADGIFGDNLMRRFNLVFDYRGNRLFIKPNQAFGVKFD